MSSIKTCVRDMTITRLCTHVLVYGPTPTSVVMDGLTPMLLYMVLLLVVYDLRRMPLYAVLLQTYALICGPIDYSSLYTRLLLLVSGASLDYSSLYPVLLL